VATIQVRNREDIFSARIGRSILSCRPTAKLQHRSVTPRNCGHSGHMERREAPNWGKASRFGVGTYPVTLMSMALVCRAGFLDRDIGEALAIGLHQLGELAHKCNAFGMIGRPIRLIEGPLCSSDCLFHVRD
jgi:hypothetical protein